MKLSLWEGLSIASLILGFFSPWCLAGLVAFVAAEVTERLANTLGKKNDTEFLTRNQEEISKLRSEFRSLESKIGMHLGKRLP